MKIKLTRAIGGHKNGDTITTTNGAARHLIDAGAATEVQSKKPRDPETGNTSDRNVAKKSTRK